MKWKFRHQYDRITNSFQCDRYNKDENEFETIPWRDVKVGDIIKIKNDNYLPADSICLTFKGKKSYVATSLLNGESVPVTVNAHPDFLQYSPEENMREISLQASKMDITRIEPHKNWTQVFNLPFFLSEMILFFFQLLPISKFLSKAFHAC